MQIINIFDKKVVSYIWHKKHEQQKKKINCVSSKIKPCIFQWTPLTKQNSHTDWEKIFAKQISGKGLLIRMYCNNSFQPTQIKNGQRILKDIFSERRYTNDK